MQVPGEEDERHPQLPEVVRDTQGPEAYDVVHQVLRDEEPQWVLVQHLPDVLLEQGRLFRVRGRGHGVFVVVVVVVVVRVVVSTVVVSAPEAVDVPPSPPRGHETRGGRRGCAGKRTSRW